MDKLIYITWSTKIEKDIDDLECKDFLAHCIWLMQMLWYSNENICKALEDITIDDSLT